MLEATLERTKTWWDDLLGTIEVHTPELAADFIVNHWLSVSEPGCRIWGRSAFYQPGGAFGFRDQLQDVMALLYTHPAWRANTSCSRPAVSSRRAMSSTGGTRRAARASARGFPMISCGCPSSSRNTSGYRRCGYPARDGSLPQCSSTGRWAARDVLNARGRIGTRHAVRALPPGGDARPDDRAARLASYRDTRLE